MKKKTVAAAPGGPAASIEGLSKVPQYAEWMTATCYEDGTPRMAPTLTIWCQGGEWRANLRDRAEGLCLWLSAATHSDLIKLVDEFCQSSDAPWRHDEFGTREKGKRVKDR
jgi:hypothetical protein